MYYDLIKLGCTERKSLTLQFPDFLDKDLLPHFIRGYFDGDGCIWLGNKKVVKTKDSKSSLGFRFKTVQNTKFTFTGNNTFISKLQDVLINIIHINKTKLNYSKTKSPNVNKNVCTMEYSGRNNIKLLYNYMYKNATYYELNKKDKFEKILCAFKE